ncbi:hypothetical protein HDZ31DRAFT_32522 [Schizophyllum fasciatum]
MSEASPSSSEINSIINAGRGNSDVPQEREDAMTQKILALFPDTPERRTAINRWKKGKEKVLLLVGSPRCLLNGTFHAMTLHLIHIVPRTLWKTHPELFLLLQGAIGIWITCPDGIRRRVLNLDSSFNSDLLTSFFHNLFDGYSVVKSLGTGVIFLVPENLEECLEIIRKGKRDGLNYKEMFPRQTYTYMVYIFSATVPSVPVNCFGPQLRTYAHLKDMTPEDVADMANDEESSTTEAGSVDYDEDLAASAQVIKPEDIPDGCQPLPVAEPPQRPPIPSTHWLPEHGPIRVVSHTKPPFWLWDTAYKLRFRVRNKTYLSMDEKQLYYDIRPDTADWFEARTLAQKALLEEGAAAQLFGGGVRCSPRLNNCQTEPTPKPPPAAENKPRATKTGDPAAAKAPAARQAPAPAPPEVGATSTNNAATTAAAPAAHPPLTRTASRYDLRPRPGGVAPPAPQQEAKRAAPAPADDEQPQRKKKKDGKA